MREPKLYAYPTYTVDERSYTGGNQGWFDKRSLKNYGCGLIAAADLLLCLTEKKYDSKEYLTFALSLEKSYMKVIRFIGINGFSLARGVNRYAECHHMNINARWGVKRPILAEKLREMLRCNIPVILGIGRDLRLGVRQRGICFYKDNLQTPWAHVQGHYVTVTGFLTQDEGLKSNRPLLSVASWGEKFYIDFEELCRYIDSQPVGIRYILSNILYVEDKTSD